MTNPSKPLLVACIGTSVSAVTPTCDPALDLDWHPPPGAEGEAAMPLAERLNAYERSRSAEDLARLPVREGLTLTLFEVHPLTSAQYQYVTQGRNPTDCAIRAFLAAVRKVIPGDNSKELNVKIPSESLAAPLSWYERIFDLYGQDVVTELAQIAVDRAKAGPRVLRPFKLPPGLMLPL